jgi:hypothetical protein
VNVVRGEYILAYDVQADGSATNRCNFAGTIRSTRPLREATSRARPSLQSHQLHRRYGGRQGGGRVYNAGCNGIRVYTVWLGTNRSDSEECW